jgi:hypothetical protein
MLTTDQQQFASRRRGGEGALEQRELGFDLTDPGYCVGLAHALPR